MSLYRLIKRQLGAQKWWLLLAFLLQVIGSLAGLQMPRLAAVMIDDAIARTDTVLIVDLGWQMLAAVLLQIVFTFSSIFVGARAVSAIESGIRASLFEKILEINSAQVANLGAGTLLNRATGDSRDIGRMLFFGVRVLLTTPIIVIGATVLAVQQDPGMMWIVLGMSILIAALIWIVVAWVIPLFTERKMHADTLSRIVREQIMGVRVVRAFARENFEEQRFAETNRSLSHTVLRIDMIFAAFFPLLNLLTWIASLLVMYFGAQRVLEGAIEVGALTAIVQYITQIMTALMIASFAIMELPRAEVSAKRVREVIQLKPRVNFPAVAENSAVVAVSAPCPLAAEITFKNVSYQFEGAEIPVLSELSFTIPAGKTTAIVGSTGAGKTTLLNLMLRSFDPTVGQVLLDGRPLTELGRAEFSNFAAIVPQKAYLFSGTIAENLRFAAPEATDSELWQVLEIAQAAEFVLAKEQGLLTPVAQGGTNLSGGQRQRLAIARTS